MSKQKKYTQEQRIKTLEQMVAGLYQRQLSLLDSLKTLVEQHNKTISNKNR